MEESVPGFGGAATGGDHVYSARALAMSLAGSSDGYEAVLLASEGGDRPRRAKGGAMSVEGEAGSRDSAVARELQDYVDKHADDLIGLLADLVGFRTESQDPNNTAFPMEAAKCQEYVEQLLGQLGCITDTWDSRSEVFEAHPVVVGRLPGQGGGRSLAMNGHVDVVPVGDVSTWTKSPWTLAENDGLLYGRGTSDMKGGVAACLGALKAVVACRVPLSGDVLVHLVSDEEVVGSGSRECVERIPRPDAVICSEPTDLMVSTVVSGLEHVRIEVWGRQAHASERYREIHAGGRGEGKNAIEKVIKIVTAIQELERMWANTKSHPLLPAGANSILPGLIVGGPGGGKDGMLNAFINPGTTPDYCSVEYNLWFYPGEDMNMIKREFEDYVQAVSRLDPWLREHPPRITWAVRGIEFPSFDTSPDDPFIRCLMGNIGRVGQSRLQAVGYAADISWYGEKGIKGALFGPGSISQAHGQDEYVRRDDLLTATKAIALLIADWCGSL
jgi:acetylornithine deacetylase/succinyl-diaminopimelate desuccinylase family protein